MQWHTHLLAYLGHGLRVYKCLYIESHPSFQFRDSSFQSSMLEFQVSIFIHLSRSYTTKYPYITPIIFFFALLASAVTRLALELGVTVFPS